MPWGAAAAVAVGYISSKQQSKAAREAAEAQRLAAGGAVAEERRQFDISQEQFAPFREAGVSALEQQQALLGLSGVEAQQAAFGKRIVEGWHVCNSIRL